MLLRIHSENRKQMQWVRDLAEQRLQLLVELCWVLEIATGKSNCARPPIRHLKFGYPPPIEKNSNSSDSQYQQQFQRVDLKFSILFQHLEWQFVQSPA